MSSSRLIAVDIGNARMKFGLFAGRSDSGLPKPERTLPLLGDDPEFGELAAWLARDASRSMPWWIASVNRPAATRLLHWLGDLRPDDRVTMLAAGDLPLAVSLERPDMVGIDRLVDAVAVNRLRDADRPAVVVDVGTAITVDFVSADGVFQGGAILPGIQMSARALYEFTDLLPLLDMSELTAPPPALGVTTETAMESGLFWGAVGAVRQLTDAMSPSVCGKKAGRPQIFLTGGAGARVAELLGDDARYVPDLTLAGIALSAMKM